MPMAINSFKQLDLVKIATVKLKSDINSALEYVFEPTYSSMNPNYFIHLHFFSATMHPVHIPSVETFIQHLL